VETAIYGRVSTEEQALEGYSIRGQVEKLKSYVSAKSWSIYDVYLDEGISGKNLTARPAITRMLEDIKAGHVKNVLIYKLDRLTRSVADLVYLIDLFKTYDCAFNSLSESIDTSTASGRMFVKIIGIFAEFERENIGERVRLGKERKAREGYTTACGFTSYGYQRKTGEKVQTVDPREADIVRRIFDMYVRQNMSLSRIAKTLNLEKIPSKTGVTWNSGGILTTLKNCNYIGLVRYSMDTPERYFEAEGKHEAIISEEIFREAQILIEKNKKAAPTKQPAERNYFAGLLYCELCGMKLKTHVAVRRANRAEHHFICSGRIPGVCSAKMVTARKVENAVIAYIAAMPGISAERMKEEQEAAAKRTAARIEELKEKMTVLDAKEQEMLDSYITDNATLAEYRGVKAKLDGEREKITAEMQILTPAKAHTHKDTMTRDDVVSCFKTDWQNYTNIEKRQFLLKYIRKITLVNRPIKGQHEGKCEITGIEFNV